MKNLKKFQLNKPIKKIKYLYIELLTGWTKKYPLKKTINKKNFLKFQIIKIEKLQLKVVL